MDMNILYIYVATGLCAHSSVVSSALTGVLSGMRWTYALQQYKYSNTCVLKQMLLSSSICLRVTITRRQIRMQMHAEAE